MYELRRRVMSYPSMRPIKDADNPWTVIAIRPTLDSITALYDAILRTRHSEYAIFHKGTMIDMSDE
jgi:hypothetical protein